MLLLFDLFTWVYLVVLLAFVFGFDYAYESCCFWVYLVVLMIGV